MTPGEVRKADLSAIIARKVARIHSLRAPINKEKNWLFKMLRKYANGISKLSLADVRPDLQPTARDLLYFDFDAELKWLHEFLSEVNSPVVFCHNDVQVMQNTRPLWIQNGN